MISVLYNYRRILQRFNNGYVDLQSPAGYALGAIVINYDGKIFGADEARMLWETTRTPELVLGDLAKHAGVDRLEMAVPVLTDTFLACVPGCDECAFQSYCGADPMHHLAMQGDHVGDKSKSFFCQLQRLLFDELFTILSEDGSMKEMLDTWR